MNVNARAIEDTNMLKLNLQQQPKSAGYLECFMARPGHKIVTMDFAALEPKVTAYYSRDTNLMNLYGPNAKANDVYLYNAAKMGQLGKKIRECGYDPDNPTPESIKKAKKECKLDRAISKKFTLSANYGASAKKLYEDLQMQGIDIALNTCYQYHREFWDLYKGIKVFEEVLLDTYKQNKGWILNGYGRPLAIDDYKTKDIVNRFVQSTGHDILVVFIRMLYHNLKAAEIPWMPWIIDFHDETMIEVPIDYIEPAVRCFEKARAELNEFLNWDVSMTGDVEIASNLAEIKCEDYHTKPLSLEEWKEIS